MAKRRKNSGTSGESSGENRAKKTPAKKTPTKKTPAKKTPPKKAPAKKTPVEKTPVEQTPAEETASRETRARKTSAKKAAKVAKKSPGGGDGKRRAAAKTKGTKPRLTARQRERAQRKIDDPYKLDKTVIAIPLFLQMKEQKTDPLAVVIDLNLFYAAGQEKARERVIELARKVIPKAEREIRVPHSEFSTQFLYVRLTAAEIRKLAKLDRQKLAGSKLPPGAIYAIWPDFAVKPLLMESRATIKSDAAQIAFSALGEGITWAIVDSGVDASHWHFKLHDNLKLQDAEDVATELDHRDFTGSGNPTTDDFGHGTHVAGIVAGEMSATKWHAKQVAAGNVEDAEPAAQAVAVSRRRDEHGDITYEPWPIEEISGIAPRAKLVSLKVLDGSGAGSVSQVIEALAYVQHVNDHGRRLRIHGVNLSLGYDFDAEWFACGQSPLCVEVDRLVRSGVVVVVAAGNTGHGFLSSQARGQVAAGMSLTINDPGNADLAITVGATHRAEPHVYGVSYFSSKGPTGDGRLKPDLVAPGEKVFSCATGDPRKRLLAKAGAPLADGVGGEARVYRQESGTSMAAPHVSGAIAAFLSIRREFRGRPERVKEIFLDSATDLRRERYFQGCGLVDLMRAIQSV